MRDKTINPQTRAEGKGMAMDCPNCGLVNQQHGETCQKCGKGILSPGEAAASLATLVQSQDSVTWVAFSLAMTLESVLLVGFYEIGPRIQVIGITGILLAFAFFLLVVRSNRDMRVYYSRASARYPSVFDYTPDCVSKLLKARIIMMVVLIAWIPGWLWVLLYP